jgi:hypothetical protein
MERQHPAIRGRIGDEQDHDVYISIASLQRASSVDSLRITNSGLGLNPDFHVTDPDERVPGPQVPRDRQGNLDAHWQIGRQAPSEPLEQRELASVKRGVTAGHSPDHELQADGCARSTGLIEGQPVELPTLDTAELRMGHPDAAACNLLARRG